MLPAIDFNDKPRSMAGEVDDVWPYTHLPPEMRISEWQAMSEMKPELALSLSWNFPHLPRMRALRCEDRTISLCPYALLISRHCNQSDSRDPHP
jgi:hypothetical protein